MAFCTNCGQQLTDGGKFCANCGVPIVQALMPPIPIYKSNDEEMRKTIYDGDLHKCPRCGEYLKAFETVCPNPDCGFELRNIKTHGAVKEFSELLTKEQSEARRINLIQNFHVPNSREDIMEFMILATSNFDENYYATHLDTKDESDAWLNKIEQCYQKAQISLSANDFEKVEGWYQQTKERIRKSMVDKPVDVEDRIHKAKERKSIVEKKSQGSLLEKVTEKAKNKKGGIVATIAGVGLASAFPVVGAGLIIGGVSSLLKKEKPKDVKIKAGVSSESVKGQYYEDVIDIFARNGFINIKAREDGHSVFHKSGTVKKVKMGTKETFSASTVFPMDENVIILYYS